MNVSTNNNNFQITPHQVQNDYNSNNFGVNANFNNGANMTFSNASQLGSHLNQRNVDDRHYFEGAQMSKVQDFIAGSRRVDRSGY